VDIRVQEGARAESGQARTEDPHLVLCFILMRGREHGWGVAEHGRHGDGTAENIISAQRLVPPCVDST
jgi:hypothetical protein